MIHAPAAEARRRVPQWWGAIEALDERTCEYRTGDDDLYWLAVRISMLAGFDFDVDGPPELLQRLRAIGRRIENGAVTPRSAAMTASTSRRCSNALH